MALTLQMAELLRRFLIFCFVHSIVDSNMYEGLKLTKLLKKI